MNNNKGSPRKLQDVFTQRFIEQVLTLREITMKNNEGDGQNNNKGSPREQQDVFTQPLIKQVLTFRFGHLMFKVDGNRIPEYEVAVRVKADEDSPQMGTEGTSCFDGIEKVFTLRFCQRIARYQRISSKPRCEITVQIFDKKVADVKINGISL